LQMDDAAADADGDGLRAVVSAEFAHDVLDVNLDGFFGNGEVVGDVAIAVAFGNLAKNLNFAFGEGFIGDVLREALGDPTGDLFLPGVHLADDCEEFLRRHALEQVAARSGLEGALNFDVAFEGGEHDDARFWKLAADGGDAVNAAFARETQVHQGYIG